MTKSLSQFCKEEIRKAIESASKTYKLDTQSKQASDEYLGGYVAAMNIGLNLHKMKYNEEQGFLKALRLILEQANQDTESPRPLLSGGPFLWEVTYQEWDIGMSELVTRRTFIPAYDGQQAKEEVARRFLKISSEHLYAHKINLIQGYDVILQKHSD